MTKINVKTLILVAAAACAAMLTQPAVAGAGTNGLTFQGLSLQGIRANGMGVNGWQLQGIRPNGMGVNGWQLQGIRPNGMGVNGAPAPLGSESPVGDGGGSGKAQPLSLLLQQIAAQPLAR